MRTTSDAVIAILEDYDDDISLVAPIEVANMITTDNCVNDDSNYSDAKLELIERYLSAHEYECIKRRQKFRAAGKVQESLESKIDLYLDQTVYGQQAMLIDNVGNLAALNNAIKKGGSRVRANIRWLGTDET